MAREKFQTLTEQMFYILLCLRQEQCGADIMARVAEMTGAGWRSAPAPCTTCWRASLPQGSIAEMKVEGRKRSYLITETGERALDEEYRRLLTLAADYEAQTGRGGCV